MYFDGKGLLALAATVASQRTARLGAIAVAILPQPNTASFIAVSSVAVCPSPARP